MYLVAISDVNTNTIYFTIITIVDINFLKSAHALKCDL